MKGVGARLPFIMVNGGAPIAISLRRLRALNIQTGDWRRNSDLAVLLIALPISAAAFRTPFYHWHHAANGVD